MVSEKHMNFTGEIIQKISANDNGKPYTRKGTKTFASKDGGKTFTWQKMGFQGHPLNMLKLPDNRVLLTYGYRHQPYGIRARILNAECTDFATSKEFIIRDDGGTRDLGYSWPVMLNNNRVLVVYYFNKQNGVRHIAGSVIETK